MTEISVMAQVNSRYIVRYFDSFVSDSHCINIVMEYCEHQDLYKYLRKQRNF
jgi:serine/threonine protein kinase